VRKAGHSLRAIEVSEGTRRSDAAPGAPPTLPERLDDRRLVRKAGRPVVGGCSTAAPLAEVAEDQRDRPCDGEVGGVGCLDVDVRLGRVAGIAALADQLTRRTASPTPTRSEPARRCTSATNAPPRRSSMITWLPATTLIPARSRDACPSPYGSRVHGERRAAWSGSPSCAAHDHPVARRQDRAPEGEEPLRRRGGEDRPPIPHRAPSGAGHPRRRSRWRSEGPGGRCRGWGRGGPDCSGRPTGP
jgi:hypothetical protein